MEQEALDYLIDWFTGRDRPLAGDIAAMAATRYLEDGLIDSVMMIELILDIEGHFGIRFGARHLADPRLATVGGLAAVISDAST